MCEECTFFALLKHARLEFVYHLLAGNDAFICPPYRRPSFTQVGEL
jgi:hypothetical protein